MTVLTKDEVKLGFENGHIPTSEVEDDLVRTNRAIEHYEEDLRIRWQEMKAKDYLTKYRDLKNNLKIILKYRKYKLPT